MKILFYLICIFTIIGCNKSTSEDVYKHKSLDSIVISPELKPMVQLYEGEMKLNGVDLRGFNNVDSILLVDDSVLICNDSSAIGCTESNVIKIRRNVQYMLFGDDYLRVVVYHELGHAVLRMGHVEIPFHIMSNNIIFNIYAYTTNWDFLVNSYVDYYKYCKKYNYLY